MNGKKWFLAGLAGFAVMFALSGLWYMVLMSKFYRAQDQVFDVSYLSRWV
jgi:hypothetical protein